MSVTRWTSNCLFEEPWWLDLVAWGRWRAVEIYRHGELVARWPYVEEMLDGVRVVCMPELTQTLGPWLREPTRRYPKDLSDQYGLLNELMERLPPHDLFVQNLHHSRWNVLPMHWNGFRTSVRITYCIDRMSSVDRIWAAMLTDVRTQIRRAGEHVAVRAEGHADEFLDLHRTTFTRQGRDVPWSLATVRRLVDGAQARKSGRLLIAEADGVPCAAIFVVWDSRTMYYLLAGSAGDRRRPGAVALLLWQAIRLADELRVSFDFEGSMLPRVERLFRAFGAVQKPYLQLWRSNGEIETRAKPGELPADTFQRLRDEITNCRRMK